ncbi:MAG: carboxypeptidase-like regulatory domain-containing protein, partial [Bacteroidota bacterium]
MTDFTSSLRKIVAIVWAMSCFHLLAQENVLRQNLRGTIFDQATLRPLEGAQVVVIDSNPTIGAISDAQGQFVLQNLPVGRYDLQISYIGFETQIKQGVLVSSVRETVLEIPMNEQAIAG